jgi:hypothetical protein
MTAGTRLDARCVDRFRGYGRRGRCAGTFARLDRFEIGKGAVQFHALEWADLPTMYHVVNALGELPVFETRGGSVTISDGASSYRDQRIIEMR